MTKDIDGELASDIANALAKSPFKIKGLRIETLRLIADRIVAHLRLARWRFELGPPVEAHGPTTTPARGTDANSGHDADAGADRVGTGDHRP